MTDHKILIIEDELSVRHTLDDILTVNGFKVCTASGGKAGIDQLGIELPDLILCDVAMPEFDGYQVLQVIKQHPRYSNIPFVFLTAKAQMDSVRRGIELGADDYIIKPFDEQQLLKTVLIGLVRKVYLEEASGQRPAANSKTDDLLAQDPNGLFTASCEMIRHAREVSGYIQNSDDFIQYRMDRIIEKCEEIQRKFSLRK